MIQARWKKGLWFPMPNFVIFVFLIIAMLFYVNAYFKYMSDKENIQDELTDIKDQLLLVEREVYPDDGQYGENA